MYHLNEITELETLINKVKDERFQLQLAQNAEIQDVLNSHFNYFKELTIKASNESACFYMFDKDLKYEKEIFNLYFYERYNSPVKLELSYYTSSTQSDFELDRLIKLGSVAKVIKDSSEIILKEIVAVQSKYKNRLNKLYAIGDGYQRQIRAYQKANDQARKAEIELALKTDGIVFSKGVNIQIKSNYTPTIDSIKLTEVSKSGKTGTITYHFTHGGNIYTEEKVNVERILDQIFFYHKDIVQDVVPA